MLSSPLARMLSGAEFPIINCYLIRLFQSIMGCFAARSKTAGRIYRMPKASFLVFNKFPNNSLTVHVWEYFHCHPDNKGVTVYSGYYVGV